jgi:hypothetical protein
MGLCGIMWDYLPKVGLWCTLLSQRFPPRGTQTEVHLKKNKKSAATYQHNLIIPMVGHSG